MDEIQIFSIRIFNFLSCHVFSDALEYVSRICGGKESEPWGNTAVDIPGAMALGILWDTVVSRSSTVCIWLLQRDAYIDDSRIFNHGFV